MTHGELRGLGGEPERRTGVLRRLREDLHPRRGEPRTRRSDRTVPPRLGQHNAYVFGELLGVSAAELETLRREAVV